MSEIENRIRQSLARQATSLPERTDLGGLTDRIARRNRRRVRGISVALVLALVAGPTLGYLAGQRGGEVQTDVATGAGGGVTVERPPGPLPTVVLGGSDSNATATAGGFSSEMLAAGGFSLPGVGGPLAKSFVREVDGTTIRLYRAAVDAPENAGPSWSDPPATCFPNGYAQADVSTEDAVGIVSGSLYAELPDGSVRGSLGTIGVSEGAPQWVVVAQGPPGAAVVRATFPGGQTDEMEPIDGVVVLVGPASLEPGDLSQYETTMPLEAFDDHGRSLGTGTARYGGWSEANTDCFEAPQLPPPGDEQPADPAAARAEIEQLYGVRFADRTDDERVANLDDPTGMREVYDELRNGPYHDQVLGSRTVLDDLVFLSATRAAVQYHTEIPDYPNGGLNGQVGEVVLVDGSWKLTRETVCRDIQLAGVTCP